MHWLDGFVAEKLAGERKLKSSRYLLDILQTEIKTSKINNEKKIADNLQSHTKQTNLCSVNDPYT